MAGMSFARSTPRPVPVSGVSAPPPRPTWQAALLLSLLLSAAFLAALALLTLAGLLISP